MIAFSKQFVGPNYLLYILTNSITVQWNKPTNIFTVHNIDTHFKRSDFIDRVILKRPDFVTLTILLLT